MNRQEIIDFLLEHYHAPPHRGRLDDADVVMPGGNPDCGDVVTMFLRVDREHDRVAELSFLGEGCIISQAAASLLTEQAAHATLAAIEAMGYTEMMDDLGREVVQSRPRCATLALSTLKAAVKKYRTDQVRARLASQTPAIALDDPAHG